MGLNWLASILPTPDNGLYWVVPVILLWLMTRLLQIFNSPDKPKLHYKKAHSPFVQAILDTCPTLSCVFRPTFLWGKNGHFQTIVHVKMGRTNPKWPDGQRFRLPMPDGATMSYDLFDPCKEGHRAKFTLALCPGIANSSECIYLSTFASYAQTHGFRVAILNHLGALKSEVLTSPRIFTYGGTEEYARMVDHLLQDYPDTKILAVGFSMGGNIVTKYLGESVENQQKVLCAISVCQGYEINEANVLFREWTNLRRIYAFVMALSQQRVLSQHRDLLFSEAAQRRCGKFNEMKVFSATSLSAIDENYSWIRAGYESVDDYYRQHSSAHLLQYIKVPMLFMNAEDDPICPPSLLRYPREFVEKNDNCIFVTTKHGGHLGFFEGGILIPDSATWLDRVIIEYADAVTNLYLHGNLPQQTGTSSQKLDDSDTVCDSGMQYPVITLSDSGKAESTENKKDQGEEKRGSLKRGSLLKQATSYVQ